MKKKYRLLASLLCIFILIGTDITSALGSYYLNQEFTKDNYSLLFDDLKLNHTVTNQENTSVSSATYGEQERQDNQESQEQERKPREPYLVGLKQGITFDQFLNTPTTKKRMMQSSPNTTKVETLPVANALLMHLNEVELTQLQNNPNISFIEPDSIVEVASTSVITKDHESYKFMPVDTEITPWGVYSIGADLAQYNNLMGKGIKIGVIDTGISPHNDLDIVDGVSFVDGSSYIDDNGHGTHVSGTIAAKKNDAGVIGVAPEAELYAIKVLNSSGRGSYSQVIQGIEWAIEHDMNIINMSFGGMEYSKALHEAVQKAVDKGIIVVASAGNHGAGTETELYPALFSEVISVGAVTKAHKKANYSSVGSQINLVAPGSDILSTTKDGDYGVMSGTSMAAPHVTGALADIWAMDRQLSVEEVKQLAYDHATPLGEKHEYGVGLLNVAKSLGLIDQAIPVVNSLEEDNSVPEEPIPGDGVSIASYDHQGNNQTVNPGDMVTVSLKLSDPKTLVYIGVFDPAGDKIMGDSRSNVPAGTAITFVWATSHFTVPGKYRIKYAYSGTDIVDNFYINVVDASSGLRSPTNLSVSATETSIQLNWDRVSGADSYVLKLNGTLVDRTSNTQFRFTGLQPNMTYRLEVAAVNSNATSSFSSISTRTSGEGANGAPAAPTGLKATSSSTSITLNWDRVANATEYIVKKNGSVVGRTADTTYILKDLSNSTAYTLEVAASNSYGTSSYAVIHKTTGEDIPAPTGIKITAATKDAVTISWNSVPGAVAYSLRKNGTYETSITTTSYTFKNLTPNTSYTLEVASKNSSGQLGEYASIKHNTANVLLPPSNLRTTAATHNSLTLAWTSVNGATAYSLKKNGIYETSKTDTSHTFKDLKPNTQYKFEVASKKNDEVSDYISILKTTLYPVPTDIIATNVTETSMRIVWNGTYGAQYSVRVNGVYWSTINSNYFTLDNLNPNTLYTIEVASKNGSGELSDYIKLSQKTLQDLVKPVVKMSLDTKEPYMINEELSFTLSATDNVKVAKTTMYVDFNGSRIKEQVVTSSKYSYTPRSVGSYRFTYEAVDTSGNTAAVSVNVTVDKKRDVVVFVPGFLGSEIVRGNSTLWPTYLTLDSLDLNDYGNPKDGSTFGSIIKYYNVPNPFNSKRDVAEEFINSLKDMGIEVVEAPYDWRRDLRNASSEISKYVDEAFRLSKGQRVTIVTHSTGGIVARHYLLTNPFAKEKVENFINLASPNLGTVRSIKGLVAGDTLGVSTGTFPFDIIRAKEMVQNMPAVYQLLPGKKFVDAYQNLYRNQFDFTSYYLDDYREGNIVNNYSELKKYISKNHNKFLYEDPESSNSFRYKIENYALDPSIKEYRIIAHGYQTITQFKKAKLDPYYGYGLDWKYRVLWGEGDDVVPILSANFNDMYNSTNYYTRSRHVGLITKEDKNDDSKNRGFYDSLKIIRNIVVDNRPPLENEFPRISNEQIKAHGIYFEAAGRLTAFDAKGNTAGFNSEGKFINEIPDLAYEVLDNSTFLFVPNGLKLSIKFEGSDTDNLNMGFTSYEGDIPGNSNIIEDVKMKKNSKVSFNFVGGQDNAGQTDILYDFNNNGSTEILHPSKEITAAEYFDTAAPVTTHTLSGTIKNDNWYVTPVTMTLHPTDDGGSGVSKTIYQINDGPEMEYTAPVEIKQNGVLEIKYYSIDKAENKEEKKSFTLKIDMEAPTVPENVRATHTSINSIGIEWNTSKDNLGYVKYQIFNYDKFIGETEENKFIIDNQLPNTDFSLVIKAVDKAGNESESNRFYTSTISTVPMLIAGEKNSAYVKTDRTLWMWGDNEFGQAGLGTTGGKASMAMKIANLENVIGVAVGSNHTLVLTQDGRVWSWGYGYYGQLGDKNRTYSTYPTPEKVPNLDSVVAVTAIGDYSMALKKDGTVWRWGGSSSGVEPQKLNFTGISAMAQGNPRSVGIVLKSDGTVWDLHGKQVQGLDGIVAISQGDGFSVALRNDGTVWTWGGNYYGQLGDGTTTNRDKPGMVKGLDEVEAISVGEYHVIAMKKDGSVWAWGDNREGQLGDGTKTNKLSPVQLAGIDAEGIAAGNNYGMALQKNGIVWSWGNNSFAQLGDGTIEGRTVPVQVKENQTLKAILRYPAGTQNTPDKSNVTLPSIGWNIEGAWLAPFGNYQVQILDETGKILVDSGIQKRYVDVTNTQGSWVLTTPLEANKIVQVRVKVSDGSLWSEWSEPGWMKYELPEMQATLVAGEKNSAYVKADGTLWMWGDNGSGQVGLGTEGGKASKAMKVAKLENVIGAAMGKSHTLAVTQDGQVWSWGYGYFGQLGDKNRTFSTYPTPEKVPNLNSVVAVAAVDNFSMALKKDGTIWRWGGSSSGVEPQKLSLTGISAIAQGSSSSVGIALRSDGTVWDLHGKQVQGLDGVVAISQGNGFSAALRKDGTVRTWGGNYYGQLGDGTTTNRETPVMVKGLDEVEAISVGEYHVIAMKKDGSVWAWGDNREGQLGDGTKINKQSPVQLAGIDAAGIAAGNNYGMALQKNGTVWSWGNNSFAQLGDGTIEGRTVPVQVKENQTLKAILRYPAGTQNTPDKSNVTLPSIGWNIEGVWSAPFGSYQVQILDETGKILVDSGVQKRHGDATSTQGSWVLATPLEANKIVQVRVKVSDGSLWSEWSEPGWMKYELPEMQATLVAGEKNSAYVKADGTLWVWGDNGYGQLGSKEEKATIAVKIEKLENIMDVAVGSDHILALARDGSVWSWGHSYYGQLGDERRRYFPSYPTPEKIPNLDSVVAVAASGTISIALKKDGSVWTWGGAASGTSHIPTKSSFTGISAISSWKNSSWQSSDIIALRSDGTVFGSGGAQIKDIDEVVAISQGYGFSLALRKDGTVWSWGGNYSGQLGDGTTTNRVQPGQVKELSEVIAIKAGESHAIAIKKDGSVWVWGDNQQGQLGIGNKQTQLLPVKLTGIQAEMVAGGASHSVSLQQDGTVWSWGKNDKAQLGNGTNVNHLNPTEVQFSSK